jgi:VanZ family protein
MSRIRRSILPVAFYVLLIFGVSSIPSLKAPTSEFVSTDKIAHFVEYFVLGLLLFRGVGWNVTRSRPATFGFLVAVAVSIGAMDEIYQSFVPGREMSILDWSADALGAAAGTGLFVFTGLGNRPPVAETPPESRDREGDSM